MRPANAKFGGKPARTVLATAAFYRLTDAEVQATVERVVAKLNDWRTRARAIGIPAVELAEVEHVFVTHVV
ncbi:MAG: hypothetical protein WKH97_06835 [Casimicrobiaceae bacterium]